MELPIKSALFMVYHDGEAFWDYEAVDKILEKYGCNTQYWRLVLRFNLMELAAGGLLEVVDEKMDDDGYFDKEKAVCKYKITEFGLDRAKVLE